jgi:hypothetical protein
VQAQDFWTLTTKRGMGRCVASLGEAARHREASRTLRALAAEQQMVLDVVLTHTAVLDGAA